LIPMTFAAGHSYHVAESPFNASYIDPDIGYSL
jgi:hypothetical protein